MRYRLRVFREREGVGWLTLEAAAAPLAAQSAQAQGYSVLSIRPERSLAHLLGLGRSRFPLLLVTQQLLALLRAGLNLVEAFEALAAKEQAADTRKVLEDLLEGLRAGQSLSATMEQLPRAFPPLYVATVRASERTSNIQDALGRYVAYQRQVDTLRRRISSALVYPGLLVAAGALVTAFLMLYVVPRFSQLYAERGESLPLLTRALIEWGALVDAHAWAVAGALVALALAAAVALVRPEGRAALAAPLARLPGVAAQLKLFRLARMYRTAGMLLQGGIPAVTALSMVGELLSPDMRASLEAATARVREGGLLSESMAAHGLTTPVALRMLRVGEQTGNMGEMMDNIAAFYDDDLARAADLFTRVFEPALMAAIGLLIGAIVVLMYLPIFELASGLQ